MQKKKDINVWLRRQTYSPKTVRLYRFHMVRLLRWLKKRQLEFESMSVDDFHEYLDETDWGRSMHRLALNAARAYARDHFGRDHSIFRVKVKRPKEKPQRTLTTDEVRKVLDAINVNKPNGVRDYAMICLMIDTGLRVSEVCRLQLEALNLDRCVLHARVKGGGHRHAAFTAFTESTLWDWLMIRDAYARPDCNRVFVGVYGHTPGGKMTSGGIRNLFRKYAKKAGIPSFSPHALRRTMATIMTGENHAPERITQIGGGWHDPKMVRTYTQAMGVEATRPFLAMLAIKSNDDILSGKENSPKIYKIDD